MLGPRAGQGGQDLALIALSGVQRFISESRATSDLSSASEVIERLAIEAATVAGTPIPGPRSSSGPATVGITTCSGTT